MPNNKHKIIASWLLVVFASFFCGNYFFVHTHQIDESTKIVHSHPYMPGGSHTHPGNSLHSINAANAALLSALCSSHQPIFHSDELLQLIFVPPFPSLPSPTITHTSARAPPAA